MKLALPVLILSFDRVANVFAGGWWCYDAAMRRWWYVRLWLPSLTLFAAGFVGRTVLNRRDVAYSYPFSTELQMLAYGGGLLALMGWVLFQAGTVRARLIGCAGCIMLAIASAVAILATIQK